MEKMKQSFEKLFDLKLNITATDDEAVRQWEKQQEEKERYERYCKTVPRRYWQENLTTFKADTSERKTMLKTAKEYVDAVQTRRFSTLVLLGTVGTGKTHLACGIIKEVGGLYRMSPAIVEEIRRAKSFSAKDTEAEIFDYYGHVKLLVVDEIGRGVASTDEQYMLYQIINERYNRRKATVLISNQTKKDFLNYIGIAAADRLAESANIIELTGASYRAQFRLHVNEVGSTTV